MGKLRVHLTFANVVSVIALLFALGLGGAWAASELSKNEVKSKHIGKGQVKAKDLGKNAVSSPKVADGSLLDHDFAPGQLPAGPQGERGPQGEPGAPAAELFGYVRDPGQAADENAVVEYGSGISGVTESGTGTYFVAFNRSLDNCAISAVAGQGAPPGSAVTHGPAMPRVFNMDGGVAEIGWLNVVSHTATDTSFLIAAFC